MATNPAHYRYGPEPLRKPGGCWTHLLMEVMPHNSKKTTEEVSLKIRAQDVVLGTSCLVCKDSSPVRQVSNRVLAFLFGHQYIVSTNFGWKTHNTAKNLRSIHSRSDCIMQFECPVWPSTKFNNTIETVEKPFFRECFLVCWSDFLKSSGWFLFWRKYLLILLFVLYPTA